MQKKSKVFITVLLIVLCLSVCAGLTYAYFTDSATSKSNIIKAGKLDVTMEWASGRVNPNSESTAWTDASEGAIFNYEYWEPGYVETYHIKIANVGTLALKYSLVIIANGTVTELTDAIDVYYFDPAEQIDERSDLIESKKIGNLTQVLEGMGDTATGNLLEGEKHIVTIALKMREDAGNRYQGLSIGTDFSVQLHATQLDSESDAFGPDYDEDAEIPCPHAPNNWVVDVEPTADAEGLKHAWCSACRRNVSETIPKSTYSPIRFTLSEDRTYYIASGLNNTSVKDVVIPDTYNTIPVREVGENSFAGYQLITSVTIPYGVTTIGDRAFYSCHALETVTIPWSVASIGENVFLNDWYLTIYCRAESAQNGWSEQWNLLESYEDDESGTVTDSYIPVVWSWSHGEKYTYTFVTNGSEPIENFTSAAIISLPTPSAQEGMVFCGWYDNAEFEGRALSSQYHSTTNHTLYAKWMTEAECFAQAVQMELWQEYFANASVGTQQVYYTFTPEESGKYAFYSLSTNDEYIYTCGYLYNSNLELLAEKDYGADNGGFLVVYELEAGNVYYLVAQNRYTSDPFAVAVGIPITYTFESDGEDPLESITSTVEIHLTGIYKNGFVFAGWYDNPEFEGDALPPEYRSDKDCTLYAKWIALAECFANAQEMILGESYLANITFGGERVFYSFTPDSSGEYTFYSFNEEDWDIDAYLYDEDGNLLTQDTYYSSDFEITCELEQGKTYYLVAKCSADWHTIPFMVAVSDIKIYTLNTNGGLALDSDGNKIVSVASSWEPRLPTPSKKGAIFLGWYDNPEFTGEVISSYSYRSETDCTLYAKWLSVAEVAAQATPMELYQTYTVMKSKMWYSFTPEESGFYTFIFNKPDNGNSSYSSILYDSDLARFYSDETGMEAGKTYYLYVDFRNVELIQISVDIEGNAHTYTFETNGGEPMESITTDGKIWLETPYKEGSPFFGGWYDNPNFEGFPLPSSYRSASDCTLYAKWITKEDILAQGILLETHRYCFANITVPGQKIYYVFTAEKTGTYNINVSVNAALYDSNMNYIGNGVSNEASISRARIMNYHLKAGETYFVVAEGYSDSWTGELYAEIDAPIAYCFETDGGILVTREDIDSDEVIVDSNMIASSSSIELPMARKDNAIFLGWYDNAELEGEMLVARGYYQSETDCTLYAKWMTLQDVQNQAVSITPGNTYTANIEANGQKIVYVITPVKSGTYLFGVNGDAHDLGGYLYDSNLNLLARVSISYSNLECELEAGETYYLIVGFEYSHEIGSFNVKVPGVYTYAFETNGGFILGEDEEGNEVIVDGSITSAMSIYPPIPQKEGAIFRGWYENADFSGEVLLPGRWYKANNDCVLYAKWMTATEVAAQATPLQLKTPLIATIATGGQRLYYSFTPDKDGMYSFFSIENQLSAYGYLYDSNLRKIADNYGFTTQYELKADQTYYLEVYFSSEYDTDSFKIVVDIARTYTFVTNSAEDDYSEISAKGVILYAPYGYGMVFVGWYDNPEFTGSPLASPYISETDCTLYAKWMTKEECFENASALESGSTLNIIVNRQYVYYAFTPDKSGTHVFTIDRSIYDDYDNFYIHCTLYDFAHNELSYDSSYYSALSIEYELEANQTYYLVLYSNRADSFNVTVEREKTIGEYFEEATDLTLNEREIVDITTGGEQVYLAFTPEETGTYEFSSDKVDPETYIDPRASLYTADGEIIIEGDDELEGYQFSIAYFLEAYRTYYLVVSLWNIEQTDPIAITVSFVG